MPKQDYIPILHLPYVCKVAEQLGFAFESVDPFSHNLARVTAGDKSVFIGGANLPAYPLNATTSAGVAKDKAHCYEIARRAGFKVPQSGHFFLTNLYADYRPAGRELADALDFADALGYPVFIKPNDSSRGELAQSVASRTELETVLREVAEKVQLAIVQERLVGEERRIFCIDGQPKFAYFKTKPALVGDGTSSILTLLNQVDSEHQRKGLSPVNRQDPVLLAQLAAHAFSLDSVLPVGTSLYYSEKANVSQGAELIDFTEEFSDEEIVYCQRLADTFQLRVYGVDLIYPTKVSNIDDAYFLEINNPSTHSLQKLKKHALLKAIWTEVLTKAFA